ncbi:hypothetical protein C8R43DRAFT_931971 [Mycena crocata]|nr:hypothetical protein C8R43DRAFT_931971 [Mycena crocata]
MLANDTMTPRPRPPAQMKRSTSRSLPQGAIGASPPPPYASSAAFMPEDGRKAHYLGSPLPATLEMVDRASEPASPEGNDNSEWLNEKSREELAELLLKADGLIKERETELGVTSAVCKSLYENNVTLKNKHDALVARLPSTPRHSPPLSQLSFAEDTNFDSNSSPRVYLTRHSRRISVSPADISLLSDQNQELLLKLENLEAEAMSADRSGRRALKQLEKEIQLLRDELEKTQARSEELEKNAQVGTEKIVEEMWRKKKEREAKFRAMRNNTSTPRHDPFGDDAEVRDFAPAGFFSKTSLSPSNSGEFPSDDSYGSEPSFEHPQQHTLVSQLLEKIHELEETNAQIIRQQSETTYKLHAVQRETESISKAYECFSAENGMEWEVTDKDAPMDGTIRFRSFRRSLDAQNDVAFPSLAMPRKARKSVIDLFDAANEAGPSKLAAPTDGSSTELSPLRFYTTQSHSPYDFSSISVPGPRQTLQAEIGDDFGDPFLPLCSRRYDLSFSLSPSPTPGSSLQGTLQSRISDARASRDHSTNALQLSVEPPSPSDQDGGEDGSLREKNRDRHRRMSQTLSLRSARWVDGRFQDGLSSRSIGHESTPRRQSITLPERFSSALDIVMENFGRPARTPEDNTTPDMSPSPTSEQADKTVVIESGRNKQVFVAFVLELWLWLQFAIIIVVFLWAMAKRGPKSVLVEAEQRAVVKRQ